MKLEFFVSDVCSDSPPAIELMAKTGLSPETINITGSMADLRRFLSYRDKLAEFTPVKDEGYAGVPVLIVNGGELVLFDFIDPDQIVHAVRDLTLGANADLKTETLFELDMPDDKMKKDLGL